MEEQIYELFSRAGDLKRVVMGLDKLKKTPCGFCFVEYPLDFRYFRSDSSRFEIYQAYFATSLRSNSVLLKCCNKGRGSGKAYSTLDIFTITGTVLGQNSIIVGGENSEILLILTGQYSCGYLTD